MPTPIETTDRPPPYTETVASSSTDDVIQPTILVLAGQTIHAETASCAPLYHHDRGIASLSRATSKVTLERVERSVRTSIDNEPSLRDRRRYVFTLERSWTVYNTLPPIKARLRSMFTALPVDIAGRDNKLGLPGFTKDAQPLFELRRRDGRWEWADKDGNAVAVEDESDDIHRLIVTATLPRMTVDALVALWCCRLWEYSAGNAKGARQGMNGIGSKLKMEKDANVGGLRGWVI
ncbi:hypothetical protein F5Y09DRAFT_343165 [Xylaria sp. FL1042]|nr:hypothetical protein F5Y09DRAFT_343165 [Xylaria sp. FL1042]